MAQQPDASVPVGKYAAGLFTEVTEVLSPGTIEQIIVHTGVPMGPRGFMGPVGPAGEPGPSTEWHTGQGQPVVQITDEIGDLYMDTITGDVWEFQRETTDHNNLHWVVIGNLMGPGGPSGSSGPPAMMSIKSYASSHPGEEGAVFLSTGPSGPPYWELSFYLPRGLDGPSGATGAAGPTGATGAAGPAGAPGTGITIKGGLVGSGPPSATDPPPTGPGTPVIGDGWVADNGDVWVWTANGWVDVGKVVGPVGPTGPAPVVVEVPLVLVDGGDGTASQTITHSSTNPYPSVRVLINHPLRGYYDMQTASIYYPSSTEIRIVMDSTALTLMGKVIVM